MGPEAKWDNIFNINKITEKKRRNVEGGQVELNIFFKIENGNGECAKETTTRP